MSNSTAAFAESSTLDVLVPEDSNFNIEEALNSADDTIESREFTLLPSVAQRNVLFFDELISIYAVLRTPYIEEQQLKAYISGLAISIEAHVTSSIPYTPQNDSPQQGSPSRPPRDVVWSGAVDTTEEPLIVVEEEEENTEEERHVYMIWRLTAFLNRPKMRINSPTILFKPSATVRPPNPINFDDLKDPYLPSGIPASINVLQPLQDDPALQGVKPQLSALRLSRVTPSVLRSPPQVYPLKVVSRRPCRAIPAMSVRVRYNKSGNLTGKPSVIASLDIEIPDFVRYTVQLMSVHLKLSDGTAEDLVCQKFPSSCRPTDNLILLYRLKPHHRYPDDLSTTSNSKTIEISITGTVLISESCRPRIQRKFETGVDFTTPLNPNYGTPTQPMQRSKRPSSLPTPSANGPRISTPALTQDAETTAILTKEIPRGRRQAPSAVDLGVTVTFTMLGDAIVGEPFKWTVFVVNRSSGSRKLAIVVIPRRRRGELRQTAPRPSSLSSHKGDKEAENLADPIVEENALYAMQKHAKTETADLVCLSTDVRIGPLNPGSCHATELTFLPLAKGALFVEAVRIIDMASNDVVDVRDLPDVVAAERRSERGALA